MYPLVRPKKKPSTAAKVLIALATCCAVGFGGCLVCVGIGANGVAAQEAKDKRDFDGAPEVKISADKLIEAYKDNEVAADEKYKGKKLLVTGKLSSIESGLDDEPIIQIGSDMFPLVAAHGVSKRDAAKLKKGTDISVLCRGDGEVVSMPQLQDCALQ